MRGDGGASCRVKVFVMGVIQLYQWLCHAQWFAVKCKALHDMEAQVFEDREGTGRKMQGIWCKIPRGAWSAGSRVRYRTGREYRIQCCPAAMCPW